MTDALDAVSKARKSVDIVQRERHHRKASIQSRLEAHVELSGHAEALVEEVVEAYSYTHIQLVEVIRQVVVDEMTWIEGDTIERAVSIQCHLKALLH